MSTEQRCVRKVSLGQQVHGEKWSSEVLACSQAVTHHEEGVEGNHHCAPIDALLSLRPPLVAVQQHVEDSNCTGLLSDQVTTWKVAGLGGGARRGGREGTSTPIVVLNLGSLSQKFNHDA